MAGFGENLEAGEAGEHGVEEEKVGRGLLEGGEAGKAVGRIGDIETEFTELVADEQYDIGIVFDQENTFHRR
jgi:hypothetical protein